VGLVLLEHHQFLLPKVLQVEQVIKIGHTVIKLAAAAVLVVREVTVQQLATRVHLEMVVLANFQ
jgi:hypothetical protein